MTLEEFFVNNNIGKELKRVKDAVSAIKTSFVKYNVISDVNQPIENYASKDIILVDKDYCDEASDHKLAGKKQVLKNYIYVDENGVGQNIDGSLVYNEGEIETQYFGTEGLDEEYVELVIDPNDTSQASLVFIPTTKDAYNNLPQKASIPNGYLSGTKHIGINLDTLAYESLIAILDNNINNTKNYES